MYAGILNDLKIGSRMIWAVIAGFWSLNPGIERAAIGGLLIWNSDFGQ